MTTGEEMRKWIDISERMRRTVSLEVDKYVIHLIVHEDSATQQQLEEAKKPISLGKHYTGRIDNAHDPKTGQEHIHVYVKGKELFAMNRDGSAHDRSHKFQIPNVVAKEIARQFPHFTLPADNFIEWLDDDTAKMLLD
jgi:hypothetical protein